MRQSRKRPSEYSNIRLKNNNGLGAWVKWIVRRKKRKKDEFKEEYKGIWY